MTATPVAAPPAGLRQWMMMASGIAGTLIYVFAISAAGMALPHMQGTFSAAADQIAWVVTSFIVASTLVMACAGWLSTRFGRRRIYLVCIVGFTAASVLAGMADNLANEVVARTLQGLFGAPLAPLGQAISIDAFPRERQGFATSVWAMGALWGTFLGPLAGGYIVEHFGWPWVFYMIVPLGALSWLCSWVALTETPLEPERRLDWVGFIALTVAIGALTLMLNRGERLDWFASTEIVLTTVAAAGALYVFVVHSLTTRQPFLDTGLLTDRTYVLSILLVFIYGGYNFLPLFVLPLLLNDVMGYPLATIGLLLSTRSAGVLFGVVVIARIVDRFDPRIVILAGFICLIVPQWAMSTWNQDVGWWDISWAMILQGIGSGVPYIAISTVAFTTLPARLRTEGMTFLHLVTNLGIAIGAALMFNLVGRYRQTSHEELTAHVSPFNQAFRGASPGQSWNLAEAGDLAALSVEIGRQATMIAFTNAFYLSAVIGLAVLPLILMLRVRR